MIDPFIESKKLINNHKEEEFRSWKQTGPKKYFDIIRISIKKDLDTLVNKTDYTICLWNQNELGWEGTHIGVSFANYYNKPIYLIIKFWINDL